MSKGLFFISAKNIGSCISGPNKNPSEDFKIIINESFLLEFRIYWTLCAIKIMIDFYIHVYGVSYTETGRSNVYQVPSL